MEQLTPTQEALAAALSVLEEATSFNTKKARDGHAKAVADLRAALSLPAVGAQPLPAQPTLPTGWVPLLIEWEPGYPEEVAYGPQMMMDRLKRWLDKFYTYVIAEKASTPSGWRNGSGTGTPTAPRFASGTRAPSAGSTGSYRIGRSAPSARRGR